MTPAETPTAGDGWYEIKPHAVTYHPGLSLLAKLAYDAIAHHQHRVASGLDPRFSLRVVGERLGYDHRSLYEPVRELIEAGFVRAKKTPGGRYAGLVVIQGARGPGDETPRADKGARLGRRNRHPGRAPSPITLQTFENSDVTSTSAGARDVENEEKTPPILAAAPPAPPATVDPPTPPVDAAEIEARVTKLDALIRGATGDAARFLRMERAGLVNDLRGPGPKRPSTFVPNVAIGAPRDAPKPSNPLVTRVGGLSPGDPAGVDAFCLALAEAVGDAKPKTLGCFRWYVHALICRPGGRSELADLLANAWRREPPVRGRYLSASLARMVPRGSAGKGQHPATKERRSRPKPIAGLDLTAVGVPPFAENGGGRDFGRPEHKRPARG